MMHALTATFGRKIEGYCFATGSLIPCANFIQAYRYKITSLNLIMGGLKVEWQSSLLFHWINFILFPFLKWGPNGALYGSKINYNIISFVNEGSNKMHSKFHENPFFQICKNGVPRPLDPIFTPYKRAPCPQILTFKSLCERF